MPDREFLNSPLRQVVILLFVVLFILFVHGASTARKSASNSVIDWLPKRFEETKTFFDYIYLFREGELLMVSWDGCTLEDPRQDELTSFLTKPSPSGKPAYFDRAFTTEDVLHEMMSEPLDLTREKAIERMKGWIADKTGENGCVVLFISDAGRKDRHAAIAAVYEATKAVLKLPEDKVFVAGTTVDSVAIDDASDSSQKVLVPFFLVSCLVLLFLCIRSFRAILIVFWAAIINNQMGEAFIYYLGFCDAKVNAGLQMIGLEGWSMRHFHADSISILVGSLCYVLTISGGIHIINYYREEVVESGVFGAPLRAFHRAFIPCTLASLTTIMGLCSLSISKVVPIQNFGIFSTLVLFFGPIVLFMLTTTCLEQSPILRWKKPRESNLFLSFWLFLSKYIYQHRLVITLISFALLAGGYKGIEHLRTTVTLHGMFSPNAKVIRDYDYLEHKIGGLIPVEVILTIPKAGNENTTFLDQLTLLSKVRDEMEQVDSVSTVLTALTYIPDLPSLKKASLGAVGYRTAFNRVIQSQRKRLEDIRFFKETETDYNWRVNLRIPAYLDKDYKPFLKDLADRAQSVIDVDKGTKVVNPRIWITGAIPLVQKAQEQLLYDLIESYIVAFFLIMLTMIVLLRGFWAGVLSMIPNIFPTAVIFGFMGWVSFPVDMGSMMTASVALGTAVDGTLHFLTWFYKAMDEGQNRAQAVQYAYTRCATAMTQTAIVCGIGMLVFAVNEFVPVARFAWLLCVLTFFALIGDLVVLPALLYSPLGRLFERKKKK